MVFKGGRCAAKYNREHFISLFSGSSKCSFIIEWLDPERLMGRGGKFLLKYFVVVTNILLDSVRYGQDIEVQLSNEQESLLSNSTSGENKNHANWVFYSVSVSPIQRPKKRLLLMRG